MDIEINYDKINVLPIFKFIQKTGEIHTKEMFRVFNMGIGLVIITREENFSKIKQASRKILNKTASIIGKVIKK